MEQNREYKIYGVYIKSLLTKKVILHINEVGKNVKYILENKITTLLEGKCIAEGFIRPNSVKIISYSSGNVNGEKIEYIVVFDCMICHPVEGMLIECTSKTITKAGIHAEVIDTNNVIPLTVFIARDHHNKDSYFNSIKENMKLIVKVIGIRYELNDPYICAIGKLVENRIEPTNRKPRLKIMGGYDDDEDDEDDEDHDNELGGENE
jgi:DNA-directed RNA polymerase subunit E'/Rpb7